MLGHFLFIIIAVVTSLGIIFTIELVNELIVKIKTRPDSEGGD